MKREDFPFLNQDVIYLDNAATTLKPMRVIEKMNEYYSNHTSNIHRGDYDAAIKTNQLYDEVRDIVAKFVNCRADEVIYTSGTTMSLNMVVFGYMRHYLHKGDVVLLNKAEHASNILPWMKLQEEIGFTIKYVPLDEEYHLTVEAVKECVNETVKVISLAHVTNVLGDIRDITAIGKYCHDKGILMVVDGAQSVPHMKVDFKNSNIDFLCFSGHKMCGPTGVGILIGRSELLKDMEPIFYGGGMNNYFEEDSSYELKSIPVRFEAGTPPVAEVIGLGEAISYLQEIGMDKIQEHEKSLRDYFLSKVENIPNLTIYNPKGETGIIAFNVEGVFAQDESVYLNHYHICVRAGNHCAKMLKDVMPVKNTVRVSFYFYNTKEDVDCLVEALKKNQDIFNIVL